MDSFVSVLGFDTPEGVVWNTTAYIAFGVVVYAFQSNRATNEIVFIAGSMLGIYAHFFLNSPLFTLLQSIIALSALLQIIGVRQVISIGTLAAATFTAIVWLVGHGHLAGVMDVVGTAGLAGIAFGLALLPSRYGFLVLASGGVSLVIYSIAVEAWVFFVLNTYFTVVNIRNWRH